MKKAVLVLAFVISLTGLKAEESQVPFKVGDVVELCAPTEPSSSGSNDICLVVKEIKGKWIASEGVNLTGKKGESYRCNMWFNTDRYLYIKVNDHENLIDYGIMPPIQKFDTNPSTSSTTLSLVDGKLMEVSVVDGKTNTNAAQCRPRKVPLTSPNLTNTNTTTNMPPILRRRPKIIPPTEDNQKKDALPVEQESN
jgi:hypothetical protein